MNRPTTTSEESHRASESSIHPLIWVLAGIIIVLPIAGSLVGIKILQFKAMAAAGANMVMPPTPINVATVREELWQPRVSSVGTAVAVQGTIVSAEADGIVRRIAFDAGSAVKAGDELVQLDVEIEEAQLRSAEAAAALTRLSYKRAKDLITSRSIAQAEVDSADASLKQAEAQVDNIRAIIAKRTVRAPFAGRLGIRRISVGQFLNKGNPVVSLQALDPIYVEFSLPQQRLGELAEGLKVIVASDSYPGKPFEGKVTAINPDIDASTRNVRIQATLANADGRLRPGMFVSVEIVLARSEKVLFIPATAVIHAPFGDSVFLVEDAPPPASGSSQPQDPGKAGAGGGKQLAIQQRFVRLGARQGDYVVALEGMKVGERIVSTGVFKLRPGMPVVIDEKLAPEFKLEPQPRNK